MGISNFLLGAIQVLAGIFLTATGLGAGLGLKLILSGALTIITGLITPQGRDGFQSSPRYGFDNIRNTTNEGGPIPVIYGREMIAPSIISQMIEPDGLDQRLKMLCLIGEGEISAITDIRINDTPIEEFDGIQTTRLVGTPTQTVPWGFRDIGTPYAANTKLALSDEHIHTGKGEVDALVISLSFPGGLYGVHKDGGLAYAGWNCTIEWATGSGPFKEDDWKPALPAKWVQKSVGGYWTGQVRTLSGWQHKGGKAWVVRGQRTQSAYRVQMRLDMNLTLGTQGRDTYSVRVRGAEAAHTRRTNIPNLTNVIEVLSEFRAYPNRALLGLVIPATAQLSGGTPRITCLVDGILVDDPRSSNPKAWSRNPVLCARDLLLSERYGLGDFFTEADLDDGVGGTWRAMADHADVVLQGPGYSQPHHRHQLDLVLDVKAPVRDWLTQMLTTARLNLFQSDGLLRLSADKDSASVRTFSEDEGDGRRHGILGSGEGETAAPVSSLVDRMLPDSQSFTKVRVRFVDRFKDYAQQVIEITDDRIPADGVIVGGPFVAGEKVQIEGTYEIVSNWLALWGLIWQRTANFIWTGFLSRNYEAGDAYLFVAPDDDTAAWPVDGALPSGFPLTLKGLSSKATTGVTGDLEILKPERVAEIQLYGVTRMTQALREARFHLNRISLTPRFCSFGVGPGDLDLEPGDVIEIYSSRLGWAPKEWMVLGIRYGLDGTGRVECREHDADVYLDQTGHIKDPVLYAAPGGSVPPGSRPTQGSDSNQAIDQASKPGLSAAAKGKDSSKKQATLARGGSSGAISGRKPVAKAKNVAGRSGRFRWGIQQRNF